MKEIIVNLRINSILLRDAKLCAQALDMEPERFMEECIEAEIAVRRCRKQIPNIKQLKAKSEGVH